MIIHENVRFSPYMSILPGPSRSYVIYAMTTIDKTSAIIARHRIKSNRVRVTRQSTLDTTQPGGVSTTAPLHRPPPPYHTPTKTINKTTERKTRKWTVEVMHRLATRLWKNREDSLLYILFGIAFFKTANYHNLPVSTYISIQSHNE